MCVRLCIVFYFLHSIQLSESVRSGLCHLLCFTNTKHVVLLLINLLSSTHEYNLPFGSNFNNERRIDHAQLLDNGYSLNGS